jgi:hypothetical protein
MALRELTVSQKDGEKLELAAVKRYVLVEKLYFSHCHLVKQSDLEELIKLEKPSLYPRQLFVENQRLLDQGS